MVSNDPSVEIGSERERASEPSQGVQGAKPPQMIFIFEKKTTMRSPGTSTVGGGLQAGETLEMTSTKRAGGPPSSSSTSSSTEFSKRQPPIKIGMDYELDTNLYYERFGLNTPQSQVLQHPLPPVCM